MDGELHRSQVSAVAKTLQSFALALLEEQVAAPVLHAAVAVWSRGLYQGQGGGGRDIPLGPFLTTAPGSRTSRRRHQMANITTVSEYTITGMTCQHCVAAVTEEVSAIDGITDVHVDLATGLLRVTSAIPLDDSVVHAAVAEAGYEVAGET